jgi:hypothetical protein
LASTGKRERLPSHRRKGGPPRAAFFAAGLEIDPIVITQTACLRRVCGISGTPPQAVCLSSAPPESSSVSNRSKAISRLPTRLADDRHSARRGKLSTSQFTAPWTATNAAAAWITSHAVKRRLRRWASGITPTAPRYLCHPRVPVARRLVACNQHGDLRVQSASLQLGAVRDANWNHTRMPMPMRACKASC